MRAWRSNASRRSNSVSGRVAGCVAGALIAAGAALDAQPAPAPQAPQAPRGTIVTDTVWSQALGARKTLIVYLPPSYRATTTRRYPVAYYLHGLGGDETNWTKVGGVDQVMDSLVAAGRPEMIIAMPDADDSWYATYNVLLDDAGCRRMLRQGAEADRDCVAWPHYDDYIAFDVVRHMDGKYRTFGNVRNRAIAGLSMGGYGAVLLALQYRTVFSAAASHSGVLSPMEFAPPTFGRGLYTRATADSTAAAQFGARNAAKFRIVFGADSSGWRSRDPATLAARLLNRGLTLPALFADCGTGDVFLPQSRAFVEAMQSRSVPIQYREWPGTHDWAYWRGHVGESLAWIASQIAPTGAR